MKYKTEEIVETLERLAERAEEEADAIVGDLHESYSPEDVEAVRSDSELLAEEAAMLRQAAAIISMRSVSRKDMFEWLWKNAGIGTFLTNHQSFDRINTILKKMEGLGIVFDDASEIDKEISHSHAEKIRQKIREREKLVLRRGDEL